MQPGYQSGNEPMWWWKVAMHLDEAQLALSNAMAHNVDDPRPAHALYDRLREGQAILLQIFRAKGLLPGSSNGKIEGQMPPTPPAAPVPSSGEAAPTDASEDQPLAASEPAVSDADHDAAEAEHVEAAAPPPEAPPEVSVPEATQATQAESPPPADPGAGSAGG